MTQEGGRASRHLRWIVPVGVVALSALLVAGAFIPAPHSGGDNATYITLGYSLASDGSYTELFDPAGLPHTKYPPVFPAMLAALMLVGARTWVAFKAVAVVYYSHWILSDPTFVAFTLLALVALERADADGAGKGWLVLGVVAAGLAYFTRSAGIPLVVALWAWLALRRRWRTLAAAAAALGLPMLLWMLRARGVGQGEYVSEFWLVNPYQPELGRVGLFGLANRVGVNLVQYATTHIPSGIVGGQGWPVVSLGIALTLAAAVGWVLEVRRKAGPAELFVPLYTGLILLWPVVWSGDRFALPLYALLLFYAALALREGARRLGSLAVSIVGAVAFLAVLLPSAWGWTGAVGRASECRALVRGAGPFACYGEGVGAFVEASAWAAANLPEGSAVLTRKPSIFYVLSGIPSRTFPFSPEPDAHLAMADELGARYELLDEWDALADRYVYPAVVQRPGAFCVMRGFGVLGATQLLGVLPPEARTTLPPPGEVGVSIARCPASYGHASSAAHSISSRVPLLDRLDP